LFLVYAAPIKKMMHICGNHFRYCVALAVTNASLDNP